MGPTVWVTLKRGSGPASTDASGRPALARTSLDGSGGAPPQLTLFAAMAAKPSKAERLLQQTDPDDLSPKQAHDLVYRLKQLLSEK